MDDRTGGLHSYDPLAALGVRLAARRLTVDYRADGLHVVNENVTGCCAETAHPSDLITCRRRADDGGVPWFFTSWREPIAPAEQVDDAAMYIYACLSRRPEERS
ncbi:hypothetical protein Arub01_27090 [Actinomadura rubrobrunea]|uniref:Uncharacterized protein n=1 Tax=Actinomadura rubrobrunea TaxID=115335 RepID=A0A9W6PU22_9ACTN|nr:hypothetical protein [Actinomadura rubrobrunea]GLW64465.1 hypothetical protein Arub01_27090 [Actinomadura rubrobrunea]